MAAFTAADLVELNVGGRVVTTKRGTLLLAEGTFLEIMFSGRWEPSLERDAAGRPFLDFSPAPFEALLSWLRTLRNLEPGKHVKPPLVPPEFKAEYEAMVKYLGMAEFVNQKTTYPCPVGALVCSQNSANARDGSRMLVCGQRIVVGGAKLLGDDGSLEKVTWKVRCSGWFVTGITTCSSPSNPPWSDPTCFAWAANNNVVLAGKYVEKHGGWIGWQQGDVAVFQLDVTTGLQMYLRRSQQVYHLQLSVDAMKEARLYFCMDRHGGTEAEVSQAAMEDLTEAGF